MSENKWGKPGDWVEVMPIYQTLCFQCQNIVNTDDKCFFPVTGDGCLCQTCYQKHVVEPNKEPPALEPIKEWSDDLVGKRVVRIVPRSTDADEYIITRRHTCAADGFWMKSVFGEYFTGFDEGAFALAPEQPKRKTPDYNEIAKEVVDEYKERLATIPVHLDIDFTPTRFEDSTDTDTLLDSLAAMRSIRRAPGETYGEFLARIQASQPITETTHSCTLEFPNGDIVEIPGPEGDEWESEIIFDEWTVRDPDSPPVRVTRISNIYWNIELSEFIGNKILIKEYYIKHKTGQVILADYDRRINITSPELLSLTKHTRTYTPAVKKEERYTELDKFPLLNGVDNG